MQPIDILAGMQSGWCELVDPAHPVVADILDSCRHDEVDRLNAIVDRFRSFEWVGTTGKGAYQDVIESGRGNCLVLSSMLCATFTAAGIIPSYVLLAGGGLLHRALIAVKTGSGILTAHAWAVVPRRDGVPAIVDPVTMRLEDVPSAASLHDRLKMAAPVDRMCAFLFDESRLHLFTNTHSCFRFLMSEAEIAE